MGNEQQANGNTSRPQLLDDRTATAEVAVDDRRSILANNRTSDWAEHDLGVVAHIPTCRVTWGIGVRDAIRLFGTTPRLISETRLVNARPVRRLHGVRESADLAHDARIGDLYDV